ncbi:hypothetical protein NS230_09385 [Methylobacterium indicum]|nr:hypothetical protein NS230_09385 [Methylobacterium indicum]
MTLNALLLEVFGPAEPLNLSDFDRRLHASDRRSGTGQDVRAGTRRTADDVGRSRTGRSPLPRILRRETPAGVAVSNGEGCAVSLAPR